MLVAIGGDFTVLDRVSQPAVLESLFGPLVQGYALDALGVRDSKTPGVADAQSFVDGIFATAVVERDGIGLGRDVRLAGRVAIGAGLVCADELIQLSVFAGGVRRADERPVASGRIRRPSRRRR
jgi:hypothetical protein